MDTAEVLATAPWTRQFIAEGTVWFASVAELEGCMAEGNTIEEASRHLDEALLSWLVIALERGDTLPEPHGLDQRYSGRFSVRVPRSLHRQLVKRASLDGCSLNQWVAAALARLV